MYLANNVKIVSLNISADGFVFNPATGESYTLNPSACLILQQLQQGQNKREIVKVMTEKFNISQSIVERDLNYFMQELKQLGMIGGN